MAIIKCSECSKDVSDKAASCPNCGNPINKSLIPSSQSTTNSNDKDLLHCPKCNSTQLSSNKKGFSGGKAVAGAVLTGGIGLLAGTIGSGSVIITCLKCGYKYKAGEYEKEKRKLNKPSDSEIINKNPSQFMIIFLSLASAIFIPLLGGSWWFLIIMPIIGIMLLMLIESLQSKIKKTARTQQNERHVDSEKHSDTGIDDIIKEYIRRGQLLKAVDFYRLEKNIDFKEAKEYVDKLASTK